MENEFMPTPGYENYGASKDGRIWSYKHNKELSPLLDKKGYYCVSIYLNNNLYKLFIHRLVALNYIPNPENKPTVDHIDRNKQNNSVENLRWATIQEQDDNRVLTSLKPIEMRDKNNHNILLKTFPSVASAARIQFNDENKHGNISACARGKLKSAYGYWWCYPKNYMLDI